MNYFAFLYTLLSIITFTSTTPQFDIGFADATGGGFSPGGFLEKRPGIDATNDGAEGNTHGVDVNGVGDVHPAEPATTSGSVQEGVVLDATKRQIESVGFDKFKQRSL